MDSDKGEVNWKSAVDQCRGKGGDLVSIENQAEQDAIEKMLSDKYKKTSVELWIGLEDTRSGWLWSDGTPTNYLNWARFQPSLLDGQNSALIYYQSNINGTTSKWQNALPTQRRQFICKIFKGAQIPVDPSPPDVPKDDSCLQTAQGQPNFDETFGSWFRNVDNSCMFASKEKLGYQDAKEKCETINGYSLVSVHSMAEQNQIQGALKNVDSTTQDYFVGLRENRQGEFSWSDGSPIDFVYWADGQPNDQSGSQQCVKMSKIFSKWSDVNCGHEYGYVCARMKAVPEIPESKQHCSERRTARSSRRTSMSQGSGP